MTSDELLIEQKGAIRWLRLNRPSRRNALDARMLDALEYQAMDADADPNTSVVVVAGEGASFCAGGDFRYFLDSAGPDGPVSFLHRISDCFSRIESSSKPWVAALHGHAVAGGLELALVCDVVLAAEGTLIGDAHLNNHLLPGGGSSVRLERAVGKSTARWMHLTGDALTAEDLFMRGWLHEVVVPDQLRARTQLVAEHLAGKNSTAQQNFKRLLTGRANSDQQGALAQELQAFSTNWRSNNAGHALRDFLEGGGGRSQKAESP